MSAGDSSWVVPQPGWVCPECAFDFDACAPVDAAQTVRGFGRRYKIPFTRGLPQEDLDALVRVRPEPGTWSALEYACHVRDALGLYDFRIAKVLAEDRPRFPMMGREQAAIDRDYNGQKPAVVVEELAAAAGGLAARLASVPADGWARVGIREDFEMSVDWMARNAVHEGSHHLVDVGRVLRAARGR